MMSIYVIDQLIETIKQKEDIIVLYYFFDADNYEESTPLAALRGILLQFLRQRPHLLSNIMPKFNE